MHMTVEMLSPKSTEKFGPHVEQAVSCYCNE